MPARGTPTQTSALAKSRPAMPWPSSGPRKCWIRKKTRTWQDRRQAECDVCAAERRRRCIVAGASDFGPNPKDSKFLQAPFVHGLNAAKYVAALLRARWVAAEQQHLLLCLVVGF